MIAEIKPLTRRKDCYFLCSTVPLFLFVISKPGKWKRKIEDKGVINECYCNAVGHYFSSADGRHYVGPHNALHHRWETTVLQISISNSVSFNDWTVCFEYYYICVQSDHSRKSFVKTLFSTSYLIPIWQYERFITDGISALLHTLKRKYLMQATMRYFRF